LTSYSATKEDSAMPLPDCFRPALDDVAPSNEYYGRWPALITSALARKLPLAYAAAPLISGRPSAPSDLATDLP
jgi:hypothetical protein